MRDYHRPMRPEADRPSIPWWEALLLGMRVFGAMCGVIVLLAGVFMAQKVFSGVYTALSGPEQLDVIFARWSAAVGGNLLDITIQGQAYPVARLLAVLILSLGAVFLGHLALKVILTGTEVIRIMSADLAAFKKSEPAQPADPPADDPVEYTLQETPRKALT